MINTISVIPKKIEIEKLKAYRQDKNIINRFSYLQMPYDKDIEPVELEDNETFICETDTVLFSTSNSDEDSFLLFYIYDRENDDFIIHHDIFVHSSINDAEYINLNNEHYVALACYEKDILVYDSCVFNPLTPQVVLSGHEAPIHAVKLFDNSLYSGGDDKTVIKWDLERQNALERYNMNIEIEKMCKTTHEILCSQSQSIRSVSSNINIEINGRIENLASAEYFVYVTTSNGYFVTYDMRVCDKPLFSNRYSSEPITGMHVYNGKIGFCSKNGEITILDASDFEVKYTENIKSSLYSLLLSEDNVLFYGDDTDTLKMKKMKNKVF